MSDKIDPGPGYRLLEVGEVRPAGYERFDTRSPTQWALGELVGSTVSANTCPLRVKLPEPPAPEYTAARVQESQMAALPKHDGHYRTLEAKGAEPIERMEALVCRGIPEDLHRIAKRNLNMAMASKHQDRAGEKSGEAWEKELQKAENYLHRAWSGRWI